MKNLLTFYFALFFLLTTETLMAQKPAQQVNDSLASSLAKLTKSIQTLEKIKISGYIQAQYQMADTLGAKSFNGGDFAAASSQRFLVRRGYFKAAYAGKLSTYVLQINANEKGFTIRDAYFNIKDPWLKSFTLTGGIFFRPFGQELSYSATQRESPELARSTQLLFPGERDLGASVLFQMPETSKFHPFKIEAGLFSGNSTNAETDDKLDFIGRIGFADAVKKNMLTYGIGISYYDGSIYQSKKDVYEMSDLGGIQAFHQLATDTVPGKYFNRQYLGLDAQFSFQTMAGKTTFRGDFTTGIQPGSDKSSSSPSAAIDYSLYLRKFIGGVGYLVQSLPGNIQSFVLKYDFYDPNTELKGDEIGIKTTSAKATNGTDISYTTWGFGSITDINPNLRLVLYYDLVKNECSKNLAGFKSDQKDNVFTVRIQYKF